MFNDIGINILCVLIGIIICFVYHRITKQIISVKEQKISNDLSYTFSRAFIELRNITDLIPVPIFVVAYQQGLTPVSVRNKLKESFRYFTNNLAYDLNKYTHYHYQDIILDILRHPNFIQALETQLSKKESVIEIRFELPKSYYFKLILSTCDQNILSNIVIVTILDQSQSLSLNKMRTDFVAHASHELRTPLTSLDGFIQTLLEMGDEDRKMQQKFLDIMRTQVGRMIRLTNGLLALSRVERDEYKLLVEQVDLKVVLKQAIEEIQFKAQKTKIILEYTDLAADGVAVICADKDQLFQIFHNLLENAIRYAPLGNINPPSIICHISFVIDDTNWPGAGWVIRFIDSGPGIEKQHIPRLTERFYRADDKNGGTGLGLSIVKHLMARHKGMLAIDSNIGEGSCFSVWFPKMASKDIINETKNT